MNRKTKRYLLTGGALLLLFIIFTILLVHVNVKPIGPYRSVVGFAAINGFVFRLCGIHLTWYDITDWLGIIVIMCALWFSLVGLYQLIKRKRIRKVDKQLLVLGGSYLLVIAIYLFFEQVIISYRPVILGESLEASYPSSHTMMVVYIMATAKMQFRALYPTRKKLCKGMDIFARLLIVVTVIGRLISGVHWFSDIVGGLLLSSALVVLYCAAVELIKEHEL